MKLQLPTVTAIAVDCTDRITGTIGALAYSSLYIEFGKVKILSDRFPPILPDFIEHEYIPSIRNINEYNQFMFLELGKYFETSHCLTIQDHAYVITPTEWENEWLQYDYIGAPWPIREDAYIANTGERVRVGNGGFSLRSKRLCDLPSKKGWELREEQGYYNEDGNITCYWRKEMLEEGIKYAPIEVAAMFSYENIVLENFGFQTFGFHRNKPGW